jgi:hypothetical protein
VSVSSWCVPRVKEYLIVKFAYGIGHGVFDLLEVFPINKVRRGTIWEKVVHTSLQIPLEVDLEMT